MLMTIVEGRKRREIDPTLSMLRQCVMEAEKDSATDPQVRKRMEEMLGFLENLTTWYEQVRRLPRPTLIALMKMGAKVAKFVGGSASKGN
jgi:DNA-binding transcriptional regulator GbsR (MarR family)